MGTWRWRWEQEHDAPRRLGLHLLRRQAVLGKNYVVLQVRRAAAAGRGCWRRRRRRRQGCAEGDVGGSSERRLPWPARSEREPPVIGRENCGSASRGPGSRAADGRRELEAGCGLDGRQGRPGERAADPRRGRRGFPHRHRRSPVTAEGWRRAHIGWANGGSGGGQRPDFLGRARPANAWPCDAARASRRRRWRCSW